MGGLAPAATMRADRACSTPATELPSNPPARIIRMTPTTFPTMPMTTTISATTEPISAEMAQELPFVRPATGWYKQHNWVRAHFGPDDDVLAEMATLKGWLKQSYVAVAPKKLSRCSMTEKA